MNLAQACWDDLCSIIIPGSFRKNEYLLKQGFHSYQEVFIEDGVVWAFLTDEQANEKGTGFYRENEFISTSALRSKNGCSIYTYQALTDTKVLTFSSEKFVRLLAKYPDLIKLAKHVKEREIDRLSKRDDCLIQASAFEKYLKFTEYYPELEFQIPLYYIASFLGITPVTLSRIRSKPVRNYRH